MTVAICVATYRRPESLRCLLEAIGKLRFGECAPDRYALVIDNDESESAKAVCDQMDGAIGLSIRYRTESKRGIAHARNAALDHAVDQADFIAFIDDDEIPQPQWLDELLAVQIAFEADVVAGPVISTFANAPEPWIVRGRFFERPRFETGTRRSHAFTGNVLIRTACIREQGIRFEPRLALSGGEDTHFFRRLAAAGGSIVWADDAVVTEEQPTVRLTVGWLVRRAYRSGTSMAFIDLDTSPTRVTKVWRVVLLPAKGLTWIMIGAAVGMVGLFIGKHLRVRGLRFMAYGAGLLSGLFGVRHQEYAATHGS